MASKCWNFPATRQKAFSCMHERKPAFPPTFKFKEGIAEYDFKRRPAWTDRIMYAVQPLRNDRNGDLDIDQLSYKSHPAYIISDHKPVSSEFTIKLYANYKSLTVSFPTIDHWPIGQDFIIEYTKPPGFEERDHDWIGLFPKNFDSLSDYIAYEYVNQAESSSSDDSAMVDMFDGSRKHHHRHHKHQKLQRKHQSDGELVRVEFSNVIELNDGESYCLLYFQNTGLRGVCGVGGMSNTFPARFVH